MLNATQLFSRISLICFAETFLHVFQGSEVTSSQLKNWYALLACHILVCLNYCSHCTTCFFVGVRELIHDLFAI